MYSLIVALALAQPAEATLPPVHALARIDNTGRVTFWIISGAGQMPRTIAVEKDGVVKTMTVQGGFVHLLSAEAPVTQIRAYRADGSAVADDDLPALLRTERHVLVATDGKKVGAAHLKLLRDEVVVLVPPAGTIDQGGPAPHEGVIIAPQPANGEAIPVPVKKLPPVKAPDGEPDLAPPPVKLPPPPVKVPTPPPPPPKEAVPDPEPVPAPKEAE